MRNTNMRKGFTMIELIFVIVIIGILAAVAIPKLAATRDDAKQAKDLANVVTCLSDAVSAYTATETTPATTISDACRAVASVTPSGNIVTVVGQIAANTKSATYKGSQISI